MASIKVCFSVDVRIDLKHHMSNQLSQAPSQQRSCHLSVPASVCLCVCGVGGGGVCVCGGGVFPYGALCGLFWWDCVQRVHRISYLG